MKNLLALFALLLLFAACEKIESEPGSNTSTGTGGNEDMNVYKIVNNGNYLLTYKYYVSSGGYILDTGVVLTGTIAPGDSRHFKLSQFTATGNNDKYYLDWYSSDAKYSATFSVSDAEKTMKEKKTGSSDTITHTIGSSMPNYDRMILYGTSVSPVWYDMSKPNDKTYKLSRNGTVTYTANGKNYTGKMVIHEKKGKSNTICDFIFDKNAPVTPPTDANLYLAVGEGFSIPYGGSVMAEVDYDNKETGRKYKRK